MSPREHILAGLADGSVPTPIGVTLLLMLEGGQREAQAALDAGGAPLARAAALLRGRPGAHGLVTGMLATVDHEARWASPREAVVALTEQFDRAAALDADAGSALYALGDADLLAQMTAEVAAWLHAQGWLEPGTRVLEIGCGAGRFLAALGGEGRHLVGLDVSAGMARAATRRAGAGAAVVRTGGRDLAAFRSGAFGLVFAFDSFPYLVQAGVAEAHVAEAARVLRPGGRLAVFNWSYDGADAAAAFSRAARAAALIPERAGESPFVLSDARVFSACVPLAEG